MIPLAVLIRSFQQKCLPSINLLRFCQGNNVDLLKWWSQYLESRGEFEKARKTYARAQDFLSLVRLACHGGQVERVRRAFFLLFLSVPGDSSSSSSRPK